jgi:predicted house-cleaning NTP pyrophosphatase (Maf/HAM1 superfamily)
MVCELGESVVWMRDYTDGEIARYIDSGDPLDKAGAYAIQHPRFAPVERMEGCRLSVMGLPLCHLGRALARFGVVAPADVPGTCRAFDQQDCAVSPGIMLS